MRKPSQTLNPESAAQPPLLPLLGPPLAAAAAYSTLPPCRALPKAATQRRPPPPSLSPPVPLARPSGFGPPNRAYAQSQSVPPATCRSRGRRRPTPTHCLYIPARLRPAPDTALDPRLSTPASLLTARAAMSSTLLSPDAVELLIQQGQPIVIHEGHALHLGKWINRHPGGRLAILHMVGRDATDEINMCVPKKNTKSKRVQKTNHAQLPLHKGPSHDEAAPHRPRPAALVQP
jgi:hypothetical protein